MKKNIFSLKFFILKSIVSIFLHTTLTFALNRINTPTDPAKRCMNQGKWHRATPRAVGFRGGVGSTILTSPPKRLDTAGGEEP